MMERLTLKTSLANGGPSLLAGILSLLCFVVIGQTPLIRALGLAVSIVGVSLALRRFGSALAILGSLAFALSPAFWSQTGGTTPEPVIGILLVVALVIGTVLVWNRQIPFLGLAAGMIVFALLFWTLTGTPRSLRLTTIFSAWTLYLLIDALLTANPRPDGPGANPLRPYHTLGLLVLVAVGVLNDPLFTLLTPAVLLGLSLSRTTVPGWYWAIMIAFVLVGIRGIIVQYIDTGWWLFPVDQAEALNIRVPYTMAGAWQQGSRWVYLIQLVVNQFTLLGTILSIVGLARLARWYPPVGIVTLVAYAAYALFGLLYFGNDSPVLLLPMLMIQMVWITYAILALGQWLEKSFKGNGRIVRWVTPALFVPLLMALLQQIIV